MRRITLSLLSSIALSFNLSAEIVHFKAEDGFKLEARYVSGGLDSTKAVLMLHQCNRDKDMYTSLAKSLASEGIHSLALDLRGYGGSTNEQYVKQEEEIDTITREKLIAHYRSMMENVWPLDVDAAYKTLVKKVGSNNIAYIGASCGGEQGIKLSKKYQPKSFIFLSAPMNETTISDFEKLNHIPAIIIAAQDDTPTFNSSNEIFLAAKNKETRLLSYKGNGHGKPLFELDSNLEKMMLEWFKQYLKSN
jgi:esterase/lipase